jgi:hypothetical protein
MSDQPAFAFKVLYHRIAINEAYIRKKCGKSVKLAFASKLMRFPTANVKSRAVSS